MRKFYSMHYDIKIKKKHNTVKKFIQHAIKFKKDY